VVLVSVRPGAHAVATDCMTLFLLSLPFSFSRSEPVSRRTPTQEANNRRAHGLVAVALHRAPELMGGGDCDGGSSCTTTTGGGASDESWTWLRCVQASCSDLGLLLEKLAASSMDGDGDVGSQDGSYEGTPQQ
jgi:hypothetical protein